MGFMLLMVICAVAFVAICFSLISDWESSLNRQRIEVQMYELKRRISSVRDAETLYYVKDFDGFFE